MVNGYKLRENPVITQNLLTNHQQLLTSSIASILFGKSIEICCVSVAICYQWKFQLLVTQFLSQKGAYFQKTVKIRNPVWYTYPMPCYSKLHATRKPI